MFGRASRRNTLVGCKIESERISLLLADISFDQLFRIALFAVFQPQIVLSLAFINALVLLDVKALSFVLADLRHALVLFYCPILGDLAGVFGAALQSTRPSFVLLLALLGHTLVLFL